MMAWLEAGGPVMAPLLAVGLLTYALLFDRLIALYTRASSDDARASRAMIRALIASAPLLGLLGTVTGMVNSFEALVSGGQVASLGEGIAHALRTTQYGLAIAAPALVVERIINRRAAFILVRHGDAP